MIQHIPAKTLKCISHTTQIIKYCEIVAQTPTLNVKLNPLQLICIGHLFIQTATNIHRFSSSQQFLEVFWGRFEKKLLLIIVNHQTDMEIVVVKRTRFSHETRASSNDRANGTRQWFRKKRKGVLRIDRGRSTEIHLLQPLGRILLQEASTTTRKASLGTFFS